MSVVLELQTMEDTHKREVLILKAVKTVLEGFPGVFDGPKQLPPKRDYENST